MRMQFGTSSYERAKGDLPELPVVNMIAEDAPSEETGLILQSRPPLHDAGSDMGTGTVDALFRRDGVLSGNLFGVAGGNLYMGTTLLGAVGTGTASIAGNETGILVTAGAGLWFYDGITLASVVFPDSADVSKVFAGASRFWAIRANTGKVYWTGALDTVFDALNFATAESIPDKLLDALWLDDVAVLFGKESVEFWPNTGDPDLPITPLEGRVFEQGVRATGCATIWNATFAWVGNDHVVYLNGQEPQPISNPGLNAKIAASVSCRLFALTIDGKEHICLRLDEETHVFAGRWSRFETLADNWSARCYADGVMGGANGKIYTWGSDNSELGSTFERRFRGGFPLNSGGLTVSNIVMRCNVGQTTYLTGDYVEPTIEMRVSRDGGKTWGAWKAKSLGAEGDYRQRVQWRSLGMASHPGFLAEWRVTDPVDFRVSDILINEKYGGR